MTKTILSETHTIISLSLTFDNMFQDVSTQQCDITSVRMSWQHPNISPSSPEKHPYRPSVKKSALVYFNLHAVLLFSSLCLLVLTLIESITWMHGPDSDLGHSACISELILVLVLVLSGLDANCEIACQAPVSSSVLSLYCAV